jgi:hypothetical protein
VCRAVKVLCAAPSTAELSELRRAVVAAHWELVGGATTVEELVRQVDDLRPDIVVIDARFGIDGVARVRAALARIRIVTVGAMVDGSDGWAPMDGVREAVLGMPPVGGPVRS